MQHAHTGAIFAHTIIVDIVVRVRKLAFSRAEADNVVVVIFDFNNIVVGARQTTGAPQLQQRRARHLYRFLQCGAQLTNLLVRILKSKMNGSYSIQERSSTSDFEFARTGGVSLAGSATSSRSCR